MLFNLPFSPTLLFGLPHGMEWVIIGIVILLFFGGKKIPELIRGVGKGVNEFNKAKKENRETGENEEETDKK